MAYIVSPHRGTPGCPHSLILSVLHYMLLLCICMLLPCFTDTSYVSWGNFMKYGPWSSRAPPRDSFTIAYSHSDGLTLTCTHTETHTMNMVCRHWCRSTFINCLIKKDLYCSDNSHALRNLWDNASGSVLDGKCPIDLFNLCLYFRRMCVKGIIVFSLLWWNKSIFHQCLS